MPSPTTRQDKAPVGLLPRISSCWWGRSVEEERSARVKSMKRVGGDAKCSSSGAHLFADFRPVLSWARKIRKGNQVFPPKKTTRSLSVVEGIVRDALVTKIWESTFTTFCLILNRPGLPEEVGRTGLLSSTTDKTFNSTGVSSTPAKEDETPRNSQSRQSVVLLGHSCQRRR
jgi:hypothetical protein